MNTGLPLTSFSLEVTADPRFRSDAEHSKNHDVDSDNSIVNKQAGNGHGDFKQNCVSKSGRPIGFLLWTTITL
jgi:hypothetical protein